MRILLAPQEFKGSLTAIEACEAMAAGARRASPDLILDLLPISDGGSGLVQGLVSAQDGVIRSAAVTDPLGRPVQASFGIIGGGRTAVIELAAASGLALLGPSELDPLRASTYGTGQLLVQALDLGLRDFIIGLGGSATNDGGAGIAQALGARLLDSGHRPIGRGGGALTELATIDATTLDPRLRVSRFVVASDVRNPLCGPQGASAIFGPQKGATPELVAALDEALRHYAIIVERDLGIDVAALPGAGAAGGAGAGLVAFLHAELRSGFELMAEATHLRQRLRAADLALTGEGRLDSQSGFGKVVGGLAELAAEARVPLLALAGSVDGGYQATLGNALTAAFSIVPGPLTLDDAIAHAAEYLAACAEAVLRTALAARTGKHDESGC